ncbi:MAG: pyruvate kinase [Thermoanaerobaculia bacterium]|nr:Pyruvate kinase [Thermoanaerobaculia bacterium]MCK6682489.1 pyruvate kinase [Thermoanaerobaculia bacterium]
MAEKTKQAEAARGTKIVATIGARAEDPAHLRALLSAGVDVVRINSAHAKPGEILRRVALVRDLEKEMGRPVGVLLDLGGPKIRVGPVEEGTLEWKSGQKVEIVPGSVRGAEGRISVTYPALLKDVRAGDEIRINDGRLRIRIDAVSRASLSGTVLTGGKFRGGAGVNFPHSILSAPALTAKDKRDLEEGLQAGIDLVGLSFVRTAAHVRDLRKRMQHLPSHRRPWIVAKIERPEAVANLTEIAFEADVMMVARGDLGVEIGLSSVPRVQREIVAMGRRLATPVIVATQMLESMIENASPTRAEVSDVSFAVHDGADAVMLSGETAVGSYPVEAVRTMAEIARTAEIPSPDEAGGPAGPSGEDVATVIANAACLAADQIRADRVVVYTMSGWTARLVAKNSSTIPVIAFTPFEEVRRKMTIIRDVTSFVVPEVGSVEEIIQAGDAVLMRQPGLPGATIVEIAGVLNVEGAANSIRVRKLGEAPTARLPRRPARGRRGAGERARPEGPG